MPDGGLFPPDGGTSIPDGILADKIFALIRPDLVLALQGTYPGRGAWCPGRGSRRSWAFLLLVSSFLLGFVLGLFSLV